jgi:hypothetical protein
MKVVISPVPCREEEFICSTRECPPAAPAKMQDMETPLLAADDNNIPAITIMTFTGED